MMADANSTSEETQREHFEAAKAVKDAHERDLMAKPNVVGVGVGLRQRGGVLTNNVVVVVMVRHKLPPADLQPDDMIPPEIDGVPVDVQEIGEVKAQ